MTDPQFHRPTYPPPPGYGQAPQYPNYPQRPNYPQQQPFRPSPSAVTAILAAVLSILGGLRGLFGAIAIPLIDSNPEWDPSGFWRKIQIALYVSVAFAALLLIGGILLLTRKKISRVLIGIGGVGTLIASIGISIANYNHTTAGAPADATVTVTWDLTGLAIIGVAFNVATLILAFLPSTSRWLTHRPDAR
ncbi:hypothetical protein [Nocardia sp. NPDC052566]|uniref:hypothetical protein n=1 Tax=Nocardia sp. NPDC052566 TaxID=3364330 RepID=UPI0037CA5E96